jgi:hypothetical protein
VGGPENPGSRGVHAHDPARCPQAQPVVHDGAAMSHTSPAGIPTRRTTKARPTAAGQRRLLTGFPRRRGLICRSKLTTLRTHARRCLRTTPWPDLFARVQHTTDASHHLRERPTTSVAEGATAPETLRPPYRRCRQRWRVVMHASPTEGESAAARRGEALRSTDSGGRAGARVPPPPRKDLS